MLVESASITLIDLTHYDEPEISELLNLDTFLRLGSYKYFRPDTMNVAGIYTVGRTDLVKAARVLKSFIPTSTQVLVVLVEHYGIDLVNGQLLPDILDVSRLASLAPVVKVYSLARSVNEKTTLEVREETICSELL